MLSKVVEECVGWDHNASSQDWLNLFQDSNDSNNSNSTMHRISAAIIVNYHACKTLFLDLMYEHVKHNILMKN